MRPLFRAADSVLRARLRSRGYASVPLSTRRGLVHAMRAEGDGLGPPLVVLHGLAAAGHFYRSVFEPMRPFVRSVIAPDLPGHGKSPLPPGASADALIESLGEALASVLDEPAIVFGNSLGGAAAIRLASARPELVRGLFLVAPGGAPMPEPEIERFLQRFELRTHGEALAFVDGLFAERHPLRHLLAWGTQRKFQEPETRAILSRIRGEAFLAPEMLSSLSVPVHVVWGGADRVLPIDQLSFFREHLPERARIELVPHYGHTPQFDHPHDLHVRLRRFVDRLDEQDRPRAGLEWASRAPLAP